MSLMTRSYVIVPRGLKPAIKGCGIASHTAEGKTCAAFVQGTMVSGISTCAGCIVHEQLTLHNPPAYKATFVIRVMIAAG